mmetsp:Transcript_86089/g.266586  ORF Transcript_86089/g.266586 Transcript_86089/m.266586 type:complete len:281 (+) Transcript_86089:171-1013(+)
MLQRSGRLQVGGDPVLCPAERRASRVPGPQAHERLEPVVRVCPHLRVVARPLPGTPHWREHPPRVQVASAAPRGHEDRVDPPVGGLWQQPADVLRLRAPGGHPERRLPPLREGRAREDRRLPPLVRCHEDLRRVPRRHRGDQRLCGALVLPPLADLADRLLRLADRLRFWQGVLPRRGLQHVGGRQRPPPARGGQAPRGPDLHLRVRELDTAVLPQLRQQLRPHLCGRRGHCAAHGRLVPVLRAEADHEGDLPQRVHAARAAHRAPPPAQLPPGGHPEAA